MDARRSNEERKKAIEAKRKRLDEIRRNKAASASSRASAAAQAPSAAAPPAADPGLDNLIESLLSKPDAETPEGAPQEPQAANGPQDAAPDGPEAPRETPQSPRRPLTRATGLGTVSVARRERIQYHKEAQTDMSGPLPSSTDAGSSVPESPVRRGRVGADKESSSSPVDTATADEEAGTDAAEPEEQPLAPPLSDEERASVERDEAFQGFLAQGVRVVERAMRQNEMFDVAVDYGGLESSAATTVEKLVTVETVLDERWSKDRPVAAIQFSPHHKELFLVAYSKRQASAELDWTRGSADPDGVVLIWSAHMTAERPEYVFTCQSAVLAASFHPYASNFVIGATYSGQIVTWDLRAKSAPVQRSILSPESHTHPVYSMAITGTVNANSLASVSTDGRLCLWSLANVGQPSESRMLKWNKKDVTVTAMAFPDGETNEMCVGAEDGRLLRAQIHGNKAGVQSQREAHFGPVTSLDFHKGTSALADLMLSASMDWTVKLWSQRQSDAPLATFQSSNDYIFDARWSPVHPAVFATVSGSGVLELWNINVDLEVPQASVQVTSIGSALAKVQWAASGRRILAGDSHGRVQVLEVAADLATPRRDEWSRLEATIAALVQEAGVSVPTS